MIRKQTYGPYAKGICHHSMVLPDSVVLASCNDEAKLASWMYFTWTVGASLCLHLLEHGSMVSDQN